MGPQTPPPTPNSPLPSDPEKLALAESGVDPNAKVHRVSSRQLVIFLVVCGLLSVLLPGIGLVLAPIILIFAVAIYVASRTLKRKIALDQVLAPWAAQHGYSFALSQPLGPQEGRLFKGGRTEAQDCISGTLQGLPFMGFNYTLTITRVTNRGTEEIAYGFTVMKVDFTDTKPQFACFSKQAVRDIPPEQLKPSGGMAGLSLEGDFNSYFTLEAEKGQETEVLEIFAPDFMQMLIDKLPACSFEMTPHSFIMYLPRPETEYSINEYAGVYDAFVGLAARFLPLVKRVTM